MRFDARLALRVGADENAMFRSADSVMLEQSGGVCAFRWLGHAGVSLAWGGRCLVFDPVVTRRLAWVFGRHLPVVAPHAARPDLLFLTHVHRDHFHGPSLRALAPASVVIPRGAGRYLPPLDATVVEMSPGESVQIGGFQVRSLPMRHPGWRQPFTQSYPALGYTVTRGGYTVFHAGDAAASPVFEAIGREEPPDAAFLPIGAYSPRFVLRDKHFSPEEAVEAARVMRARLTVPVHFGTFRLSFEPMDEPYPRFVRAAEVAGLKWAAPWGTA